MLTLLNYVGAHWYYFELLKIIAQIICHKEAWSWSGGRNKHTCLQFEMH